MLILRSGTKPGLDQEYLQRPALGTSKPALGACKGNGNTPLGVKQRIHSMCLISNVSSELSKLFCNNLQILYKNGLVYTHPILIPYSLPHQQTNFLWYLSNRRFHLTTSTTILHHDTPPRSRSTRTGRVGKYVSDQLAIRRPGAPRRTHQGSYRSAETTDGIGAAWQCRADCVANNILDRAVSRVGCEISLQRVLQRSCEVLRVRHSGLEGLLPRLGVFR